MIESNLHKIYKTLCSLPGGNFIYNINQFINKRKNKRKMQKQIVNFKKYSVSVLDKMITISKAVNVDLFLFFGTHLGAYRDHSFISHDIDMDFGILSKDDFQKLIKYLKNTDCNIDHCYYSPINGISELTLEFNKIHVDVFLINKENNSEFFTNCYCTDAYVNEEIALCRTHKIFFPSFKLQTMEFLGHNCLIPSNSNDVLSSIYGDDYMIPNPNHKSGSRCKHIEYIDSWISPVFYYKGSSLNKILEDCIN